MAGWTFGMLLLTTLAGIVQTQVVLIASNQAASLAAIDAAWLVFMLPHSVITVSIATAYFTRMSEHAAGGALDRVRDDLSSAVRGVSLILVLASAVLVVVAYPFAAVFQPGLAGASALGNVIIAFAIGLVGFSILFIVQRTFYALGDTRTPFFFTLFQVVVFSIGALTCIFLPVEWIAVGVALSTTIATTAQLLLAIGLLRRRLDRIDGRRIIGSLARDLAAAVRSPGHHCRAGHPRPGDSRATARSRRPAHTPGTPAHRPPPPTGTNRASSGPGCWRRISTPTVPCPAITSGSSKGWT